MGLPESLEGRINSYFIGSGLTTSATTASISVRADADVRDNNSIALNDLRIDLDTLNKTVWDLIETLRTSRLIPNP